MDDIIREWIRQNLELEVELDDKSGPGNSVSIGLKFSEESKPFQTESIYIPEES